MNEFLKRFARHLSRRLPAGTAVFALLVRAYFGALVFMVAAALLHLAVIAIAGDPFGVEPKDLYYQPGRNLFFIVAAVSLVVLTSWPGDRRVWWGWLAGNTVGLLVADRVWHLVLLVM